MRNATMLVVLVTLFVPHVSHVSAQRADPIFTFHNAFWPNMHHFLYVLGRARAGTRDAQRRAVVEAPRDAEAIAGATEAERRAWEAAVEAYQRGLSTKDPIFDDEMISATRELASAGDAPMLEGRALDPELRAALEAAAPVYRKIWWPNHHKANRARSEEVTALLEKYGAAVRDGVTRAYGEEWPAGGQPIQMSGYANWAGAYSTRRGLIVMSSLDPGNAGTFGLESVFHEVMHQWKIRALFEDEAKRQGKRLPRDLPHASIFYTAGEVTRRVVPGHVTYAEANGMWKGGSFAPFKAALDRAWLPWLDGKGTRAEAIAALISQL
jgi:hypothetical protein